MHTKEGLKAEIGAINQQTPRRRRVASVIKVRQFFAELAK
jgi:hypothetical protein